MGDSAERCGGLRDPSRSVAPILTPVSTKRQEPQVAQEVAPFGIGITIVEPGGARTDFRYGGGQVATPMPEYEGHVAHAFMRMLDPANGLAAGDPARMAARIIESVDVEPAPLRIVLGTLALDGTIAAPR